MGSDLRAIYLQDHWAGSTVGTELAKRAASSNAGTELGDFLGRLSGELDSDRQALRAIMVELEVGVDRLKSSAAWGAEKLGRLKPNGRLFSYSPLSRLVELEGLHVGISGKLSLWQNLQATSAAEISADLGNLIARAQGQLAELEPYRTAAASEAFAGPSS
ncbi:MAG: hypothetical protein ACR2G3_11395 [Solirubrobacterales bacterium]